MKGLILCHPRKASTHFMMAEFEKILAQVGWTADEIAATIYDTVDILQGGTFQADAFSQLFVSQHLGEYKFVAVPDCAGPWVTAYRLEGKEATLRMLTTLILSLIPLLQQNGFMIISKIHSKITCPDMIEALANYGVVYQHAWIECVLVFMPFCYFSTRVR